MTDYLYLWWRAFVFTQGVELCVAAPLLAPSGASRARRLGAVLAASTMTHPAVWFIFPELGLGAGLTLALSEAWAVMGEWGLYALCFPKLSASRSFAAAALANAASLGLGLGLRAVGLPL